MAKEEKTRKAKITSPLTKVIPTATEDDVTKYQSEDIGILDYGVRQTSLEEVFLKIAKESEAAFQQKKRGK